MRTSSLAAVACVAVAVALLVLAVLYATGTISVATSHHGRHYKHAILLVALAISALVAASFLRPRPVT